MKRSMVLLLAVVLLFVAAVPAAADGPNVLVRVRMLDSRFRPKIVTIALGDTVGWKNLGALSHTTTSFTGLWDSGSMAPGATFMFTPGASGTYDYFCSFHVGMGMVGRIIVP